MSEIKLNTIEEAIEDFREGKFLIVVDDEDRENEGDFIIAAEKITPEKVNFMLKNGRGVLCAPITEERCQELELDMQVANNTSLLGTPFTITVDKLGGNCTTGVSMFDRAETILALADPKTKPSDLGRPGHINPLRARSRGVLRRAGHTEAAVDLARLAGLYPAGALIEIINEDGTMARLPQLIEVAKKFDIKIICIKDLISYRLKTESIVENGVEVDLPTQYGHFRLIPFRQKSNGLEHIALIKGKFEPDEPILVRVHSSCATGDIFGSMRCECGEQLHKAMQRIEKEGRLDEWCADNMSYFAFMFGKENIVAAHLHRDEETPHIHITLVPIVKGERKRRKREEQTKKRYRKKPTDTVRLCADDIMTRLKLKTYQDTYAIAMAKYGLQRGIDGSTARHKSTQQYYRDTQKLVDSLKAEVVDLQERKEAARQELRQAKKEVQTEKLKGAATTAATNIAESVGSFFGSNKVKTLERENKNLHERVSELQEEARQREQQQAKHIQEITDAYELRHRKLSEFTDFVKRYFPYVEKLIPTINFLRERLGFNDDIIRRLCTFKDVPIKGKLHSSEFNQGFETQRAVCSIKEDENGKFDFKIDGVSHISWFRKKMNEFREAIGIPKPRQNRGMQL